MSDAKEPVRITQKIVGWSVRQNASANDAPADVDPRTLRIERREEGSWESVTTKIKLTSASGSKTIYFVIGFGVVCGRRNGERVCIERPLEFFVPAGQTAAEHQWVSATMRTLSLAARGGFLVKALADLRKVSWDRGPVWYGKSRSGKGMVHDSEVAAIAWAIERELHKRGYLNENGEEQPLAELVARYAQTRQFRDTLPLDNPHAEEAGPAPMPAGAASPLVLAERCPRCRGELAMKDGCPTCLDCAWSKCG
ncbi:MAG: hypothetical protein QM661_03330 [Solimonas sp.]